MLGVALFLCPSHAIAAPDAGRDPARARVAVQCAAFWEGAGFAGRAAPYRALAHALGNDRATTERMVARLRPAMAQLARERIHSPRAAGLWARHAALCRG